jgi:hypothetical protein
MGPACTELRNELYVAELTRYRGGQHPDLATAEFLLRGGVIGAKQRADDRLDGMLAMAKLAPGQPYGTEDEEIARVVLGKLAAQRKAGT